MAEQINLSAPIAAKPGASTLRVTGLVLQTEPDPYVKVMLMGDGIYTSFGYDGAAALTLIRGLSRSDLSAQSMQRRILERLVSEGRLNGTISGDPD